MSIFLENKWFLWACVNNNKYCITISDKLSLFFFSTIFCHYSIHGFFALVSLVIYFLNSNSGRAYPTIATFLAKFSFASCLIFVWQNILSVPITLIEVGLLTSISPKQKEKNRKYYVSLIWKERKPWTTSIKYKSITSFLSLFLIHEKIRLSYW